MEKASLSIKKKHINIYYLAVILISYLKITNALAETCNLNLLQVNSEIKRV
jgi:hypothetical protein